ASYNSKNRTSNYLQINNIKGYIEYDVDINIAGIILNQVSSEALYQYLKKPIEDTFKIPCLGYLPHDKAIILKSRHLGLVPTDELKSIDSQIDVVARLVEKCINLDKLLDIAKEEITSYDQLATDYKAKDAECKNQKYKDVYIGIAKDKAFSFYYEDNLKYMESLGVNLVPFSPMHDKVLPRGLDGLYIGGGFPEIFAKELEQNYRFRNDLKKQLEEGLPAYAECGGLIYLCKTYKDINGNETDMAGFFNNKVVMTNRLQRFGYVEIETKSGLITLGHEFHHTKLENAEIGGYYNVTKLSKQSKKWKCGLQDRNVLAAYPHIHFYSNLEFVSELLSVCLNRKQNK
ncbi:cobyrinate a,c-diamide synthase, partial [bacterium AH-315-G05]|nr:cobyrinate a,c-diamide synthase [bacterium AH-315-G05]